MDHLLSDEATQEDQLGYDIYAKCLADLVHQCDTPFSIGIHGKWGSGKTSLMKMVLKELQNNENKDIKTIWFNSWEFQYEGNIILPLLQTIREDAESNKWLPVSKLNTLKVFTILGKLAEETIIKAATCGAVSNDFIAKQSAEFEAKYCSTKPLTVKLKRYIDEAVQAIIGESESARLVIFIDDLDRCPPEFILSTLESIKLFIGTKRCVFFIALDHDVAEKSILGKYPSSEYVEGYIEKIIQLPFYIPAVRKERIEYFIKSLTIDTELYDYLQIIVEGMGENPRHVKRFLNVFTLNDLLAHRLSIENYDKKVLAKLLIVQFKWPMLFRNFGILLNIEKVIVDGTENDRKEFFEKQKAILARIDLSSLSTLMKNKPFLNDVANISDYFSMSKLYSLTDAERIGSPRTQAVGSQLLSLDEIKRKLKSGESLKGANLMAADLSGLDLTKCDLRGANLIGADFTHANLSLSNLECANLERAVLNGTNVSGANLSKVNLWRAWLKGCNISEAASIDDSNFYGVFGLSEEQKHLLDNASLLDFENYPEYFNYFKKKYMLSDKQLDEWFLWRANTNYFEFVYGE